MQDQSQNRVTIQRAIRVWNNRWKLRKKMVTDIKAKNRQQLVTIQLFSITSLSFGALAMLAG